MEGLETQAEVEKVLGTKKSHYDVNELETAEKDRLFQHGPLQRNETNSLSMEEDGGQVCN
jgi:hypothetical protein